MIRVHLWSWAKCAWFWAWRPIAVVRAMRHLTLIATLACTGITIIPPGPPAQSTPPPPYQPPPAAHVPPATDTPPPTAWQPPGSPWRFETPPDTSYLPVTPIPLGPVLEAPGGPEHTFDAPQFGVPDLGPPLEVASVSSLCAPGQTPVTTVTTTTPVPEPAGLFIVGAVLLFLWKALKWA